MRLIRRLAYLLRRRAAHAELADELEHHREMLERDFLARGLSPSAARDAARRTMGNETYMREESGGMWIPPWAAGLVQDVGYALRTARRAPGFALMVVLTLGLGLGATSAVFTLINAVLLRPLPYADSERLYTLFEGDSLGAPIQLASYPTFRDWRQQSYVFDAMAYVHGAGITFQSGDRAGRTLASFVSEDFFRVLGAPVVYGRALTADDFHPGRGDVAVLSHDLWRRAYGGDPALVGRTVTIGENPVTVVGVLQSTFVFPQWGPTAGTDLWMPLSGLPPGDKAVLEQRGAHADSRVIARLRSGMSLARAQEQMNGIARRLATAYPESSRWTRVSLLSLTEFSVGGAGRRLWILGGAVGLVFLVCCANVANLYLAHGAARHREFAIRAALGAGRVRVLRQLLLETLLLSSLGGLVAALLSRWAVDSVRLSSAARLPRMSDVSVDLRVMAFAAGLIVLTALLFAGLAARRVVSPRLAESLGDRGDQGQARGRRGRLPDWVLAAQVALTVMLLVGASLLLQSYQRLSRVDAGFDPEHLVVTRVEPPSPQYDEPEAARQLYERVAQAVAAVPGVESAALVNHAPLGTGGLPSRAAVGHSPSGSDDDISVLFETVSAEYFSTMGIPIVAGRAFQRSDIDGPSGPVIINETLARRWEGRSPLGERIDVLKAARTRRDFGEPLIGTVVGVARDVRHFGLTSDAPATIYVPHTHNVWAAITVVGRTSGDPARVLSAIDRAIRAVDPAIPLDGPGLGAGTMQVRLEDGTAAQRFNATLLSGFALLALLLAAVGIYGVTAYTIALRTRETGIRIALGATPRRVLRSVVGNALRVALIGVVGGVAGALALTRLIEGFLFDVTRTEPSAYLFGSLLILAVAGLAAFLPARRAASVDPVVALRS